jgi:hypothetical protein
MAREKRLRADTALSVYNDVQVSARLSPDAFRHRVDDMLGDPERGVMIGCAYTVIGFRYDQE